MVDQGAESGSIMTPHVLCVGGEDHVLRIPFLLALRERGFRVSTAGTGDGQPFLRADLAYRRYHFDRFATRTAHPAAIRSLAELVREVRPDLVQTFDTKPNLLVPFALRGKVPVVRTINGMGWVFSAKGLRNLALRPVYCALQRLAACWTAATVFQNREDKTFFDRFGLLGASPAILIGGSGIDIGAFERARAGAPSPAALRAQLGLGGDAEIVLTVSRLTRQKGIPTLLQAARIVCEARPQARFLLVGPRESEGPFAVGRDELERHAPYVVAPGARNDVPALLELADVFAFPTEYREGIPRVLLEAGLAGLPIVTTGMPGCNDVVTHLWNGYLVPPRDPGALAARILDLLRDRAGARVMGGRSTERVRREFDLNSVVGRYDALYRQVLARSRPDGALVAPLPGADARGAIRRQDGGAS